jgi:hypothetical protein
MRKVLISAAATVSTLAFAAPAAAQWAPAPAPYGNAYGYNNYGQVRSLQARVNNLQRQIDRLDQRRVLSNREARRLRDESRDLERRLHSVSRNGMNPREYASVENRIQRLERNIWQEARDGNGNRYGYNSYNGYNQNGWVDRDRDGRDDRYEDDRGTRRD